MTPLLGLTTAAHEIRGFRFLTARSRDAEQLACLSWNGRPDIIGAVSTLGDNQPV